MTEEKQGPLRSLKRNAEHYRQSAKAFHDDSVRSLKQAEEASNMADKYEAAVALLEKE